MNTMEREIRNLERTIRNAEEEQADWYRAYEDEFGETAREMLEEELVSER